MKRILFAILLTFALLISCPATPAFAAEEVQKQILPTSPLYLLVKVKESVQQFLTFNPTTKAQLLENFSEQRIREMEYASFVNDDKALDVSLDRYQTQKKQVLGYVKGASDAKVVERVKENTVEQQQTMTKMQLEVEGSEGIQQRIVETQKEIAGEVKKTVEVAQGTEEAAEIEDKIHYVWLDPNADATGKLPPLPDEIGKWEYAPGTEGRDETGRVVEITYAPGTTAGGSAGEKMEIQWAPGTEGGGESEVKYEGGPGVDVKKVIIQQAPGTGEGGGKVEIKKEP